MTLQQWLEVWLKEYNGNIKPYSFRTYSDHIRLHIVPALGRLKLQALNAPTVQRFINWMKDGDKETAPLSPKTVKSVHGVLHKALQQALILGYIKTNPADHCTGIGLNQYLGWFLPVTEVLPSRNRQCGDTSKALLSASDCRICGFMICATALPLHPCKTGMMSRPYRKTLDTIPRPLHWMFTDT